MHGETEEKIDPSVSTWLTDGVSVNLMLVKANLQVCVSILYSTRLRFA